MKAGNSMADWRFGAAGAHVLAASRVRPRRARVGGAGLWGAVSDIDGAGGRERETYIR